MNIIVQTLKEMENGAYNFTENGKCKGCGECCSNILPMTAKEVDRIKAYIKQHGIKPVKRFVPTPNPIFDMYCPFMEVTGNKRCKIYEVRPKICKDFICDPKQRKFATEMNYLNNVVPVMVRETFFGE
jgi:Fe-S-cluster containining protein